MKHKFGPRFCAALRRAKLGSRLAAIAAFYALLVSAGMAQSVPEAIERKVLGDPRLHMILNLGGMRHGCQPWRFEASAASDGRIVVEVPHPADRRAVLAAGRTDGGAYEFILGNDSCRFRVTIEPNNSK